MGDEQVPGVQTPKEPSVERNPGVELTARSTQNLGMVDPRNTYFWWQCSGLKRFALLVFLPNFPLGVDEVVKGSTVVTATFCKWRVSSNLAQAIIHRFTMTCNPNLPRGKVEG
jgi:hypothetical protein